MTARRVLVAALAIGALLLNFAIEHLLAGVHGQAELVPGLVDYSPTWNHGVSFGLFRQDSDAGRLVLIAVLAMVVAFVSFLAPTVCKLQAMGW